LRARLVQRGLDVESLALTGPGASAGLTAISAADLPSRLAGATAMPIVVGRCLSEDGRRRLQRHGQRLVAVCFQPGPPRREPATCIGDEGGPRADIREREVRTESGAAFVADLTIHPGLESVVCGVDRLLALLEDKNLVDRVPGDVRREEELLLQRLHDLGYL
jgi:hypothetical protein